MSRLPRFENYRFLGLRDTMLVYDCDDAEQFATLEERVEGEGLTQRKMVQSFAPDSLVEAMNRSFQPVSAPEGD